MKTPFLGGAYLARSENIACQRLVNLYPETAQEGGSEVGAFIGCPGLALFTTAGQGPIRGALEVDGVGYVVSGTGFYQILADGTATLKGTLSTIAGPVSMADNGLEIFIADGGGYIYTIATGVFAEITDADFVGATSVDFLDGYFLFNEPDSGRFWYTELYSGSSVDALSFATAEGSPDDVVSVLVDHRELWLFGKRTTEVWYNNGDAATPFQRMQGAFIESGSAAPFGVAKMDNSVFWLSSDDKGNGVVWRANGYTPVRVSTHAIETALASYSTLADCIAFSYQQEGHSFMVLTFPTAGKTWVYDVATSLWHERGYLDPVTGTVGRHRASCHMFLAGRHYVGDFQNGNIYRLDLDVRTDNGDAIRWIRAWRALPPGANNYKRATHHSLQVHCQSGVGISTGQGSDPQATLRWSDDGGHTWSNGHSATMGAIGKTGTRVIWRRLGHTDKLRDRVYEVSGVDPVKIVLTGASIEAAPSAS